MSVSPERGHYNPSELKTLRIRRRLDDARPGVSRERLCSLCFRASRAAGSSWPGDYVLDRFVYGHPKRVSREAPVLILRFWKEENLPGGAGNTAANVALPRRRPAAGRRRRRRRRGDGRSGAILAERGIDTSRPPDARPDYATPTKTRILGGAPHSIKQQIVRYDREDPPRRSDARTPRGSASALAGGRARRARRDPLRLRIRRGLARRRGALRGGAPARSARPRRLAPRACCATRASTP